MIEVVPDGERRREQEDGMGKSDRLKRFKWREERDRRRGGAREMDWAKARPVESPQRKPEGLSG